jgi:predicted transcriptional regulator
MRDQRSGTPLAARRSDETQFLVLALLLDLECPGPWSVPELAREIGCDASTAEAVVRLHATGLVHRCGVFVFATRAARRFCALLRE